MKNKFYSFRVRTILFISLFAVFFGMMLIGAEVKELKIMTYNIRHGLGSDDILDLERVISVIKSENPDILILNEVDRRRARSGNILQVEEIAGSTSMEFVFGATEGQTNYGNAVLSKYPIAESRTFDLPQPKWMKAVVRGCVNVKVNVDGTLISVYGTHLGLGGFQEIQTELGAIFEETKKEDIPTIIAGDFNLEYGELKGSVKELFSTFNSANHFIGKDLHTFPAINPGPQIDYILLSGHLIPKEIYTVNSIASDHLPVICIVEAGFEK